METPHRHQVSQMIKVNITRNKAYSRHEPFDIMRMQHSEWNYCQKCKPHSKMRKHWTNPKEGIFYKITDQYSSNMSRSWLRDPLEKAREANLDPSCKDGFSCHADKPWHFPGTAQNLGLELRECGAPGKIWSVLSPSWTPQSHPGGSRGPQCLKLSFLSFHPMNSIRQFWSQSSLK